LGDQKFVVAAASDCAMVGALPAHQNHHQIMTAYHHLAFTTESVVMM
jgi:hypothetical protein